MGPVFRSSLRLWGCLSWGFRLLFWPSEEYILGSGVRVQGRDGSGLFISDCCLMNKILWEIGNNSGLDAERIRRLEPGIDGCPQLSTSRNRII